jgi:transcriptional regulator with XRE-family HTH domain
MTEVDKMAGAVDPRSLIKELQRELLELDESGEASRPSSEEDDHWAEAHLADDRLQMPSIVIAAADDMIPREKPTSAARAQMHSAVGRVLVERSRFIGLLPVLLRAEREALGLSLTEVANKAKLSEDEMQALEQGQREVSRRTPPENMASWIAAIPVRRDLVLDALRRSLRVGWTSEDLVAAGAPAEVLDVESYVSRVIELLDARKEDGQ